MLKNAKIWAVKMHKIISFYLCILESSYKSYTIITICYRFGLTKGGHLRIIIRKGGYLVKKITTILLTILLLCCSAMLPIAGAAGNAQGSDIASDDAIEYTLANRIALLRVKFPHGKYWNHLHTYGSTGDPDAVTDTPCCSRNAGYQCAGQYCCNTFDGATQCLGFANKVFYDLHGVYASGLSCRYDVQNVQVGDIVRLSRNTHSAIVIARNGDAITVVDCNQSSMGYAYRCHIRWDCTSYSIWSISFYKHSDAISSAQLLPTLEEERLVLGLAKAAVEPEEISMMNPLATLTLSDEPAAEPSGSVGLPTSALDSRAVPGDVDLDGTVSAADARLTLQIAVELVEATPAQFTNADVDGVPGISAGDARRILSAAVGRAALD